MRKVISIILAFMLLTPLLFGCFSSYYPEVIYSEKPCITPYKDFDFKVCDRWYFAIDDNVYYVPKGFKTDLASIPRWFWVFLPPQKSQYVAPAIMHDAIYHCPKGLSRRKADIAFYQALREEGVSKSIAFKMWLGVRLGGFLYFNQNHDDDCQ